MRISLGTSSGPHHIHYENQLVEIDEVYLVIDCFFCLGISFQKHSTL